MTSLQDKLRAMSRNNIQTGTKPAATDCFIRETRYADSIQAPDVLSACTLKIMQGLEIVNNIPVERVLFLDTETTGLSGGAGTIAFLVGLGYFEEGTLVVRQYLMRDYDEEAYVLSATAKHLGSSSLLVTFNGSAFDVPLLESRFTMQRMRALPVLPHADLLHIARRVWKLRLKHCNLTRLEEEIFGQHRMNDIPGSEVPQRYFNFLKTREFALLEDVLTHNAQDIVSLGRLFFRLASLHEEPGSAGHPEDILSLGRVFEKRGLHDAARQCYRASDGGRLSALSRSCLADNLRKCRNYRQSAAVYEQMIAHGQANGKAFIALSKLYEHRLHDSERALDAARKGMQYFTDSALSEEDAAGMLDDLKRRHLRLLLKQGGHYKWD